MLTITCYFCPSTIYFETFASCCVLLWTMNIRLLALIPLSGNLHSTSPSFGLVVQLIDNFLDTYVGDIIQLRLENKSFIFN